MKYKVYQSFERLGDPCERVFNDLEAAMAYATELGWTVYRLVQEKPVSAPSELLGTHERQAWEEANLRTTSRHYEWGEALYIANEAMQIEGVEDEDC
jgi:hypothetical protein